MKHDVPIQSLIDHIKTAVDVDPWAKEMAEELLKEREPAKPIRKKGRWFEYYACSCGTVFPTGQKPKYCQECGKKVKWDE